VDAAFDILSHRPEALISLLSGEVLLSDLSGERPDIVRAAKARRQEHWDGLEGRLSALTAPSGRSLSSWRKKVGVVTRLRLLRGFRAFLWFVHLIRQQCRPIRPRMNDPNDIDETFVRNVNDQMLSVGMNPYWWCKFLP